MDAHWEEIEHTADWAIRVTAPDLRSLFEMAARGMVTLAGGVPGERSQPFTRSIRVQAYDRETLLVDWLTELVYLIEDEGALIDTLVVHRVEDSHLEAEVGGLTGGRFDKHIKAVTYHDLAIRQTDGGFETVIVFDV
ncbi:MAG: archease [Anaerolineae bacterium]